MLCIWPQKVHNDFLESMIRQKCKKEIHLSTAKAGFRTRGNENGMHLAVSHFQGGKEGPILLWRNPFRTITRAVLHALVEMNSSYLVTSRWKKSGAFGSDDGSPGTWEGHGPCGTYVLSMCCYMAKYFEKFLQIIPSNSWPFSVGCCLICTHASTVSTTRECAFCVQASVRINTSSTKIVSSQHWMRWTFGGLVALDTPLNLCTTKTVLQ